MAREPELVGFGLAWQPRRAIEVARVRGGKLSTRPIVTRCEMSSLVEMVLRMTALTGHSHRESMRKGTHFCPIEFLKILRYMYGKVVIRGELTARARIGARSTVSQSAANFKDAKVVACREPVAKCCQPQN